MARFPFFSRLFLAAAIAAIATALLVSACGARTGLEVPPPEPSLDADAEVDADADVRRDADADVRRDADAESEVEVEVFNDCPDGGSTYIYLFTEANELLSSYPPSGAIRTVGTINCPLIVPTSTPFSMAVDRSGLAYVLYQDGELFKVSTKDARCKATSFAATDPDFTTFGMGFTANKSDPGETLYVFGYTPMTPNATLGKIDVGTFDLVHVGKPSPPIAASGELTGTGDGRLFSYAVNPTDTTSATFLELDPGSAKIIDRKSIPVPPGNAWAFAFWGGDFWLFNAPAPFDHSNITRYRPSDGSAVSVASYPNLIVGAGVSTCAPTVEP